MFTGGSNGKAIGQLSEGSKSPEVLEKATHVLTTSNGLVQKAATAPAVAPPMKLFTRLSFSSLLFPVAALCVSFIISYVVK